ncbi:MAG TPA: signal peptidase I [Alphaproteobacteria bacterium]|nr:signal peptidase I [Alphaproteobacteria bacterium]
MARKKAGSVVEAVKTIVYAILIAIVIRTFAFEPFNIPSGSMIPTLLVGDYLFVSKYSYGYSRYSLPWGLPLISGRIFQSSPKRGDVVVFKLPTDNKTDYIKRVIGLPGDQIQVVGGVLHINGQPVKLDQVPDYVPEGSGQGVTQYIETLPNGVRHPILKRFPIALSSGETQSRAAAVPPVVCGNPSDNASIENFDPNNTPVYQVALGHYLMMGDNRDNSQDSRFLRDVGCPAAENLVGRAEILFFSTDGSAELWEPWKWPFAIRYSRLFQAVH